ncbi:polysaccharide deacetylase family protein [Cytobacillus kochii]|uniref:polysaccharide deacetylase family protein n=1 Tax=Cytobacillus kochii TaxID=859143 RepID=UPI0025A06DCB|nr:polysaccharide deacetylase family protein [Cytobacillus kochii]MDM5208409.1 polysaccharide deacetylase family protein [Cytobacillus kochii]
MVKKFLLISFFIIQISPNIGLAEASIKSREEYEKTGYVIWEVNTNEKIISITFDDGPNPIYTPQILDVLSEYNAKATFFITGSNAKKYPDVVRRIVKEGHEVANHTYNHEIDANITTKILNNEIELTNKVLKEITGFSPSLYRPVAGIYNDRIIQTANNNNMYVIMWSWHQDPQDWRDPGVHAISSHVISSVKPGDIILLHDSGGDRTQTVKALETILEYTSENGFECKTVTEMIISNDIPNYFLLH